jgi:RNA polymerase sigma-70 factor (ECF subfamily)
LTVLSDRPDAVVIAESCRDTEAFAVLSDRYAAELCRYAYRRIGREVAEDVVAETFLAAFRTRARYDTGQPVARPWLYGSLSKELAGHHRAERARYRALARSPVEPATDDPADRVVGYVSAQAVGRTLATALARLPARDRDVLLLIAWGQLSYDEAAQVLSIPVGQGRDLPGAGEGTRGHAEAPT